MKVVVTGASGFVGRCLVESLRSDHEVVAVNRITRGVPTGVREVAVGDIGSTTDWRAAIDGADVVVHLAARVHVMHETEDDAMLRYREVNALATRRLAEQCAETGVSRLIFLSSIKVNGEKTTGTPFTSTTTPAPVDPYGVSKWEAEQAIAEVCAASPLDAIVLRPTVIYGPGVGGNIRRLAGLVSRRVPLPLAAVKNRRSMLGTENLIRWIECALAFPIMTGESRVALVADPEPVSTAELVRAISEGIGVGARLWAVPISLLKAAGRLTGRRNEVARLVEDLEVAPSYDVLNADRKSFDDSPSLIVGAARSFLVPSDGGAA